MRTEINGKHTIVGAVSHGLTVANLPAQIRIAAYVEVDFGSPGKHELYIKAGYRPRGSRSNQSKGAVVIKAELETDSLSPIGIAVPALNLIAQAEGEVVFQISGDNISWKTILRRPVERGGSLRSAL